MTTNSDKLELYVKLAYIEDHSASGCVKGEMTSLCCQLVVLYCMFLKIKVSLVLMAIEVLNDR